MELKEVISIIEDFAPLTCAESFDNVGLLVGDRQMEVKGILLTLDVIEETIDEAIDRGLNVIISHHPLIFKGLKSLTGKNMIERIVMRAIKNNIAIYASHTNIDKVVGGVSYQMAEMLNLENKRIMSPDKDSLLKLVVYVPLSHSDAVRDAISSHGGGNIGEYNSCSYSSIGDGRFRATKDCSPFCGEIGKLHVEREEKIETVVTKDKLSAILNAIRDVHPYEEPAYDLFQLIGENSKVGLGVVGELKDEIDIYDFLDSVKKIFGLKVLKYSNPATSSIKRVALCGGSGAFLISDAMRHKADIYITGDVKYHDYFMLENKMTIVDIGHFESEQCILDLFYSVLIKKITTFTVCTTTLNCNPVNYL